MGDRTIYREKRLVQSVKFGMEPSPLESCGVTIGGGWMGVGVGVGGVGGWMGGGGQHHPRYARVSDTVGSSGP